MDNKLIYNIRNGFEPSQKEQAINLFWDAFKGKLSPVLKPEGKALQFLRSVVNPSYAISAISPDGKLLGIAGFKTSEGAFIGGELKDICNVYGNFGGVWRGLLLSFLERPLQAETFLMDGIFVSKEARGHGIGSALLSAIKQEARIRRFAQVRLDVIDTNPRAQALYKRHGFSQIATNDLGVLSHVFGFRKATTMTFDI